MKTNKFIAEKFYTFNKVLTDLNNPPFSWLMFFCILIKCYFV